MIRHVKTGQAAEARAESSAQVRKTVEAILADIAARGEAAVREYIKDPKAKVPGTKMTYAGLKDDKKIDDLVAYLKQFGPDGKKM